MNYNNHLLNRTQIHNNMRIFGNQPNMNQTQMTYMAQMMNNMKKTQQSKYLARLNDLEKNRDRLSLDKDELRNAIIRPIRVEKSEKHETIIKMKDLEKSFTKKELEDLWARRTNQGYKHIIRDEKFQKKDYKKKEDLIVHKVTDLDKLGVNEDFDEFKGKIETQNGELKIQYSQSKEIEHKKKFEYNNKYKYSAKFDPKTHEDLKDDNVEYFKKEQEKIEKDKKKIDDIISNLLTSNILTEEEKKELVDLQGEEQQEVKLKEKVNKANKINKEKEIREEDTEEESIKKSPIKITITSKKISEDSSSPRKDIKDIKDIKEESKLDTSVGEDLRNKYMNRKKKV